MNLLMSMNTVEIDNLALDVKKTFPHFVEKDLAPTYCEQFSLIIRGNP